MLSRAPCCTVAGIYYVEYGAFGDGGVGVVRGQEGLSRHGDGGVATVACLAAPCLPGPRSPEARCLATPYWSHPISPVSTPCPTRASPRISLFLSLSLSPFSVTFLSRLLRETYFSLYNFTSHTRCSSVSRVFREPGRKFPREEEQNYFSSAFLPSATSPFARVPPSPRPKPLKLLRLSCQLLRSFPGQVFFIFTGEPNSRLFNSVCNLAVRERESERIK